MYTAPNMCGKPAPSAYGKSLASLVGLPCVLPLRIRGKPISKEDSAVRGGLASPHTGKSPSRRAALPRSCSCLPAYGETPSSSPPRNGFRLLRQTRRTTASLPISRPRNGNSTASKVFGGRGEVWRGPFFGKPLQFPFALPSSRISSLPALFTFSRARPIEGE